MKKLKLLFVVILFFVVGYLPSRANCIWSAHVYSSDCYQWCDQLVVPMGEYYKNSLKSVLVEGRSSHIVVRFHMGDLYYHCGATYTGNELWNNDYLMGFQNIDHDVSFEERDEIRGDDYCDDDFDVNPPVSIEGTFVFNFQVPDTSLLQFDILIFECNH